MKKVEIRVPARLHMAVWNMNRFGLGKRGGGGIGLAIAKYTTITGEFSIEDTVIGDSCNVAERFLSSIKDRLNIQDQYFKLTINRDYGAHIGLGSTGSVLIGMIKTITELIEIELSNDEIINLALDVMIEEHDGKITDCFETAVGPWACLYNKMVVVDEKCKLVKSYKIDKDMRVLLVTPKKTKLASSIEDETKLLEGRGKSLDKDDYSIKKYLFSYIKNNDLEKNNDMSIYRIVDLLKYVGSKKAEIEFQEKINDGLYSKLIEIGETNNCLLSGMSSIGPTYYYIDKQSNIKNIEKSLGKLDVNIINTTAASE